MRPTSARRVRRQNACFALSQFTQNTDYSNPLGRLYCAAKQVEQAQATASKIEAELKDLKATLKNIEDARPFDQLTVDDVVAARPEIGRTVDEMVKKGKWTTPGYDEKFGNLFGYLSCRTAQLNVVHLSSCQCCLEDTHAQLLLKRR